METTTLRLFMDSISAEVDIVIPVLNEEESFPAMYAAVRSIHAPWNLFVVYDGESDTTLRTARPVAQQDHRVHLVQNRGQGVIGAIRTGLGLGRAPVVFVTAIDLPQDVARTDELLMKIKESGAAILALSRYMKGGGRHSGSWINSTLSRVANVTLPWFAGIPIRDATNGSKIYLRSFLESVTIETKVGWALALELVVKAHTRGLPMAEVPVFHAPRASGRSHFRLGAWIPEYLHWYWCAVVHRFASFFGKNV